MPGRNYLPATAAGVVDNIKHVLYLAVVLVYVTSVFLIFRWYF